MSESMLRTPLPKISCTMVTKNRFDLLKKSLLCYLSQNYTNKELILVSQSDQECNLSISKLLTSLGRQDVHLFEVSSSLSLGQMRNLSVDLSTGEVICQWDDDDLYHPDRLAHQYNILRSDENAVAAIQCDFLKYFKTTGDIYWCDWSGEPLPTHKYLCGSIMFRKKIFDKHNLYYPSVGRQSTVEEDLNILQKFWSVGKILPVFAAYLYVYVYHSLNTYHLQHHEWTLDTSSGKIVADSATLLKNKKLISDTLRFTGVEEIVSVRSKEEIAFVYKPER
jgi:glycosyltransferase involved in cell wall biosynthesis